MFAVPILMEARYKAANNWPVYLYLIDYINKAVFDEDFPVKGIFLKPVFIFFFKPVFMLANTLIYLISEKFFQNYRNLMKKIKNFNVYY